MRIVPSSLKKEDILSKRNEKRKGPSFCFKQRGGDEKVTLGETLHLAATVTNLFCNSHHFDCRVVSITMSSLSKVLHGLCFQQNALRNVFKWPRHLQLQRTN